MPIQNVNSQIHSQCICCESLCTEDSDLAAGRGIKLGDSLGGFY